MIKAALVSNFPAYSGTGKVIFKTGEYLNNLGLTQADLYLTQFIDERDKPLPENRGVKTLLPFNFLSAPFLSRFLFYFVDPRLVPVGYDLYHFGNHMMGRFAIFRHPCIVTVHDLLQFYYPEIFKSQLVSKIYNHFMESSLYSLSRADHLICVSEYARNEVFKFLKGVDSSKVSVVHNGLSHQVFYPRDKNEARKRLGLPLDRRLILHVGSEIRKKKIPLLINSFKILKEKFPDLLLLRCGEKTKEVGGLIDRLGLEEEVIYREFFDEENTSWVYSSADLLVMSSSEEGFGFPVIEAMACGLPVVSGNFTSLGEVCGGAQAAALERLEEEVLVKAVTEVLEMSEAERQRVKKRGFENAQRFSWERTARETYQIYQKVIESRSRVGAKTAAVSS